MVTCRSFKYWAPVFVWAALIFVYSSIPEPIPAVPGIPHLDKIIHTCEYAVLAFLLIRALKRTPEVKTAKFNACLLAVLISALYGLTDEFHQFFVPNRDMSVFDIFFDGIGATIGVLIYRTPHPNPLPTGEREREKGSNP